MVREAIGGERKAMKRAWMQLCVVLLAGMGQLGLFGCSAGAGQSGGAVVAEVGSERLTIDMVPSEVFSYVGQDSLTLLRAYAERWVVRRAVYQHAVAQASGSRAEAIERRVDDYRQTLTISDYEDQLVANELDTAVSRGAIEAFYEANPTHFTLEQAIVRCLSVAVPQGSAQLAELRGEYSLRGDDLLERVEPLAFRAGVRLATYPDAWLSLASLERVLGVAVAAGLENQRPRRLDFTRDSVVYLLSFHEWREKGALAPLEYVKEEAKAILLNQRRKRLVDSVERAIVDVGRAEGKVKVYVRNRQEASI